MNLLDAQEAARILGVSDRQIKYWLESGELRGRKVNPSHRNSPWLIERSSVDAMLKRRQAQAK